MKGLLETLGKIALHIGELVAHVKAGNEPAKLPAPEARQAVTMEVAQTFNVQARAGAKVRGFSADHPCVPPVDPHYEFTLDSLRDVLGFLGAPGNDGLLLTGPTGAGKSSVIRQVAARLKWPMQTVSCSNRTEMADLLGQWTMVNGSMRFMFGPLAQAYLHGHILVLEEVNLMDPGELAGLNTVLDGAALLIPQYSEVGPIQRHKDFRLIATGNAVGEDGVGNALYHGVRQMNLAFLDRLRPVKVGYLDPAAEYNLVKRAFPDMPEDIGRKMVRVANEVRRVFLGDGNTALTTTLSTRVLLRWCMLALMYRRADMSGVNPTEYALRRSLLDRVPSHEAQAISQIALNVFGDQWTAGAAGATP